MTDLPYGRGGTPLQNLIIRGFKKTRLSAIKMIDDLDAGPLYTKRKMSLSGKAETIYLRTGRISTNIIYWIIKNEPKPVPQKGKAVYFKRRVPSQSVIKQNINKNDLIDQIRMLDAQTYPKAFIKIENLKIEFTDVKVKDNKIEAKAKFIDLNME